MIVVADKSPRRRAVLPTRTTRGFGYWLCVLSAAVFIVAIAAGVIYPQALQVPDPDTSLASLKHILRSNLTLLAVLAGAAVLQRFARREVEEGALPWIKTLTDIAVVVFLILNLFAIGFSIGQLGSDALLRILPHAPFEASAFALGVYGYTLARVNRLTPRLAVRIYPAAILLMLIAAPIEVWVSGGLT